ncbi:hypothetical protein E2562_031737 [Oryza meyeriana var. granulata]|uniref:Uncharacterized protein n=1 Tax=Oryza meyeriana var. granulata TaxID=110450 RepID=A0A6G1CUC3_9ORYZ|nr:hypothetical protein E2562_031737 [Oryza meyeriana var. granulata]
MARDAGKPVSDGQTQNTVAASRGSRPGKKTDRVSLPVGQHGVRVPRLPRSMHDGNVAIRSTTRFGRDSSSVQDVPWSRDRMRKRVPHSSGRRDGPILIEPSPPPTNR